MSRTRGARSSLSGQNGRVEFSVSPQEEVLTILKNFLNCVANAKVSDHRWEQICSCVNTMAWQINKSSISFPKRKRAERSSDNGLKAIIVLCKKTERKVNQVKNLPSEERLFITEQLQSIRQD
ncbi:MAG: hypothetical protein PHX72_01875 [Candidatus Shapirobacteria bacterium]|nr:hypothetical protein [Candidatus Shapirobacteria bacterium]